jgi:hypothetical protein
MQARRRQRLPRDQIGRKPLIAGGMLVQALGLGRLVAGGGSFSPSACLVPSWTTSTNFLGARFWGLVRGVSGRLRALQGKGARRRETS